MRNNFHGYSLVSEIGQGTFSRVYLAERISDEKVVAIKIIDKNSYLDDTNNASTKEQENDDMKFITREIEISQSLNHPHIVKIFDVFNEDGQIFIVMEHCSNGTLLDYVNKRGRLGEIEARHIFKQILAAMVYLHDVVHITHRDIKFENFMLTETHQVKLIDFGFARKFEVYEDQNNLSSSNNLNYLMNGTPMSDSCLTGNLSCQMLTNKNNSFSFSNNNDSNSILFSNNNSNNNNLCGFSNSFSVNSCNNSNNNNCNNMMINNIIGNSNLSSIIDSDEIIDNNSINNTNSNNDDVNIENNVENEDNFSNCKNLMETTCGSFSYAAPEMISGEKYTQAVDMWSCGVILYGLLFGHLPFEGEIAQQIKQILSDDELEMPPFTSENLSNLINGLLMKDPKKRLTASQAQKHVWLNPEQFPRRFSAKVSNSMNSNFPQIVTPAHVKGRRLLNFKSTSVEANATRVSYVNNKTKSPARRIITRRSDSADFSAMPTMNDERECSLPSLPPLLDFGH